MSKVCPTCGNGTFGVSELRTAYLLVDGDGKEVKVVNQVAGERLDGVTCSSCQARLQPEDLVSEYFFHNVLALEPIEEVRHAIR